MLVVSFVYPSIHSSLEVNEHPEELPELVAKSPVSSPVQ